MLRLEFHGQPFVEAICVLSMKCHGRLKKNTFFFYVKNDHEAELCAVREMAWSERYRKL